MKELRAKEKEEFNEEWRRKREKKIILFCALGFSFLTILELVLTELSSKISLTASLFFFVIVNINIILLGVVIFLVFRNVSKLFLERRDQIFGSSLKSKLTVVFISLAVVPTILLFTISAFYIHNSFGKWFNTQIKASLKGGVEVSQSYYDNYKNLGKDYAKTITDFIARERLTRDSKKDFLKKTLHEYQKNYHLASIELYQNLLSENDTYVNSKYSDFSFPRPPENILKNALENHSSEFIQNIGKGNLVRTVHPVYEDSKNEKIVGVLVLSFFVPLNLVLNMEKINSTFQDYAATSPFASSIQSSYFLLLVLMTLLIIFTAIWFAFYLARHLITPVKNLAEASDEIAKGNLDVYVELDEAKLASEEFDVLTRSFNKMTQDLRKNQTEIAQAHSNLENANKELHQRHKYIEAILKNIGAGVISLDEFGNIVTVNTSAQKLLNFNLKDVLGKHYRDIVDENYIKQVDEFICDLIEDEKETMHQQEFTIHHDEKTLTIQASVATVRDEENNYVGMVVVFEDLTEMISVQKTAAWREVAKRIAHEIKNPLTPIKLSAQRLKKKYPKKTDEVFHSCVDTIIHQVDSLRDLVNEFSDFARLPQASFEKTSLSKVISDILQLYTTSQESIKFTFIEKSKLPKMDCDQEQMKRVFINLIENAIEAVNSKGEISIVTKVNTILGIAIIEVNDNGVGVELKNKQKVFEPYFTTKKGSGGLGLAIVHRIIEDHQGVIRILPNTPSGTKFVVELPLVQQTQAPFTSTENILRTEI